MDNCPHVRKVPFGPQSLAALVKLKKRNPQCDFENCTATGTSLWTCLAFDCNHYTACGSKKFDHSALHFENSSHQHHLMVNLNTDRIWCHSCESEVFLREKPIIDRSHLETYTLDDEDSRHPAREAESNGGSRVISHQRYSEAPAIGAGRSNKGNRTFSALSQVATEEELIRPPGLAGLQNLGNTCYMNAGLQALSNCPQLTRFFLENTIRPRNTGSHERKAAPNLALSYQKMISMMWNERRPTFVVPSSIAVGIKMVCPAFRGFQQQDAQEFLRCFMDQLHDELKQEYVPRASPPNQSNTMPHPDDLYNSLSSQIHLLARDNGVLSAASSAHSDGDTAGPSSAGTSTAWTNSNQTESVPNGHCTCASFSGNHRPCRVCRDGPPDEEDPQGSPRAGSVDGVDDDFETCDSGLSSERSEVSDRSRINGQGANRQSSERTRATPQFRSIISDVFDGKLLSAVQCFTCENISSSKETFQDISLAIPSREHLQRLHQSPFPFDPNSFEPSAGSSENSENDELLDGAQSTWNQGSNSSLATQNAGWMHWLFDWFWSWVWGPSVSLHDCLAAFFSPDELKDDNKYSCGRCKKLRNGVKYAKVLELPEILCIHLKRFRQEMVFTTKISQYVSFPLVGLDMSPFVHPSTCRERVTKYDLIAVIVHYGSYGSGHYICYALNEYNNKWYEYDDVSVTEVDPSVVANCEAYVLFYRKSSEEMSERRQNILDLIDRSTPLHEDGAPFFVSRRWVNRFNTFAEPGPIDNYDFVCSHGKVKPSKAEFIIDQVVAFSQSVWEYLKETFKGGPALTTLAQCQVCAAQMRQDQAQAAMIQQAFAATARMRFQQMRTPGGGGGDADSIDINDQPGPSGIQSMNTQTNGWHDRDSNDDCDELNNQNQRMRHSRPQQLPVRQVDTLPEHQCSCVSRSECVCAPPMNESAQERCYERIENDQLMSWSPQTEDTLQEVDSAFCSPIDSVTNESYPSLPSPVTADQKTSRTTTRDDTCETNSNNSSLSDDCGDTLIRKQHYVHGQQAVSKVTSAVPDRVISDVNVHGKITDIEANLLTGYNVKKCDFESETSPDLSMAHNLKVDGNSKLQPQLQTQAVTNHVTKKRTRNRRRSNR